MTVSWLVRLSCEISPVLTISVIFWRWNSPHDHTIREDLRILWKFHEWGDLARWVKTWRVAGAKTKQRVGCCIVFWTTKICISVLIQSLQFWPHSVVMAAPPLQKKSCYWGVTYNSTGSISTAAIPLLDLPMYKGYCGEVTCLYSDRSRQASLYCWLGLGSPFYCSPLIFPAEFNLLPLTWTNRIF